jgi:hypothetical protein
LAQVLEITSRRGITINHLQFAERGTTIVLSGTAPSEDSILSFKNELAITKGIKNVELSLTDIRNEGDHYSFSVSFVAN